VPPVDEVATLVVCEGDRPTLDLLSEQLADDRFKVLPAPTAADALRLCRFNHPDLLILDLALPDMTDIDLIQQIREADGGDGRIASNLPIIVLIGPGWTSAEHERYDSLQERPSTWPQAPTTATSTPPTRRM
jgi:DNA-binding response OmpR family regulator